ncbi:MAG TPA: hypothetical protein VHZ07_25170 [Bryobacteraceae bacterium]|nr:hypothetical protein [Bryobacteraceae bacterium]
MAQQQPTLTVNSESRQQAERVRQDPLLTELNHDLVVTRWILLSGFAIGLFAVLILWATQTIRQGYTAFFWAMACFAGGSLIGFLFGIPRVLQTGSPSEPPTGTSEPGALSDGKANRTGYQLVVNTHLDDVSDWLTKIAVGVGLVELEKMPALLHRLGTVIAGGMVTPGDPSSLVPFIMALILYFTTAGFMSGYLTTRMFFQRAFRIADLHAMGSAQAKLVRKVEVLETEDKVSGARA